MAAMMQEPVPHLETNDKPALAVRTFVAFVKQDCPTCVLAMPVLRAIDELVGRSGGRLEVQVQDDVGFAAGFSHASDDTALAASYHYNVDTVPTLIRLAGGQDDARVCGWRRSEWQAISGITGLGEGLPEYRPGCGSKTMDPGMAARPKGKYGNTRLASRPTPVP